MSQIKQLNRSIKADQSGQGFVEYILLIVVVVALGYAVLNRLFTPIQNWTQFYIGQYVDCLLDQGELPGLGGDNDVQDCDYQALISGDVDSSENRDSGQNANNSENQPNQGQDGQNSDENQNINSQDPNRTARGSSRRSTIQGGRGADYRGGNSDAKQINLGNPDQNGDKKGDGSTLDSSKVSANDYSNFQRRQNRVIRVRGIASDSDDEKLKGRKKRTPNVIPKDKLAQDDEAYALVGRNKRLTMDTQSKSQKPPEIDAGGFSFGKLLRIALIIIIILAIVWFVGSQVAQVARSLDKN